MTKALRYQLMDKKLKKADKVKFLGVIIDENLTWDDQIKHLENKLLATIVLIKRVKKFIPSSHYLKIYQSLFVSHRTYGISCWGGVYYSKLQKLFNIQKRCIRILFGESYSFDHTEYYATCCRTKTYQEHVALKNYALEHTKPLFNKHSLLTLHNLYASRSLVELIKILKLHSPYPVYKNLQFCPQTHHFRLLSPKYNLDISKNNYFISSVNLWNKCISKLLDNPDLFSSSHRSHLIIPGHNVNSDLTISMGTFKTRLKNFSFEDPKSRYNLRLVSTKIFICLTCIKIISCGLYLFPTVSMYYIWLIVYSSYG